MSATVALTVRFARRLGGGRFAQALAGLCVLLAPMLLVDGLLLFTDMLQPLTWLACAYLLTRIAERRLAKAVACARRRRRRQPVEQISDRCSIVVGLAAGVLATPLRRRSRPLALGGRRAGAGDHRAEPLLAGRARLPVPRSRPRPAPRARTSRCRRSASSRQQLLFLGPLAAPVWIAGSVAARAGARRPSRTRPGDRLCRDGGAVPSRPRQGLLSRPRLSRAVRRRRRVLGARWLRLAFAARAALLAVGARGLLVGADRAAGSAAGPVRDRLHARARPLAAATATENPAPQAALPQHFADMFGWPEMAAEVAQGLSRAARGRARQSRCSSAATTARPPRSTSTAPRSAARRRSAATTNIIFGGRAASTARS